MRPRINLAVLILAALLPAAAQATCRDTTFEATPYTLCTTQIGYDDLRVWHMGDDGLPLGTFQRLAADLAKDHRQIGFAMNAGMFHPNRAPVGLLIIDGVQTAPLIVGASHGNFGMQPNGVFCIGAARYSVVETHAFAAHLPACRFATQSGPMLVINGALHPRFLDTSTSTYIRNGVGVSAEGKTAYFLISDAPVTFITFARVFRDHLHTPNALYFDGSISRLDAPELQREDVGLPLGPLVGTTVDATPPTE
ncbi:MAG: phosphodiester glycosidase family protein [Paracoccaceae bacterium]|nr:phosphodiester glycosidase family protein [Paracoccaceae bacterium]